MLNRQYALRRFTWLMLGVVIAGIFAALALAPSAYAAPYAGYKYGNQYVDSGCIDVTGANFYAVSNKGLEYDPYAEDGEQYTVFTYTFTKFPGMSYKKSTNTLTLKNVKLPNESLRLYGMGKDFKIKLVGTNTLGDIYATHLVKPNGKPYPTCLEFTGKGKLTVNKNKASLYAIDLDGAGTWRYQTISDTEPSRTTFTNATKAAITVNKNVKLVLYGGKEGSPVCISGTTMKTSDKALVIKGKAKTSTKARAKKYAAWNEYKHAELINVGRAKNFKDDTIYKIGKKNFVVVEERTGDASMCRAVSLGDGRWGVDYSKTEYIVNFESKATGKVTGKIAKNNAKLVYDDIEEVVSLNNGKYYAVPAKGAKKIKKSPDGGALSWYNSSMGWSDPALGWWDKWTVYKKVKACGDRVYVKKFKTVKASKDLPKGFTGDVDKKHKASYTYSLKAAKLSVVPE